VTLRCDVYGSRVIVSSSNGTYCDIPYQCMKPSCERCWVKLNRSRIWGTRLALKKLGVTHVWVGMVDNTERAAARQFKTRNKDKPDGKLLMNMLTTYELSNKAGMLALCNMLPNRDVLREVPLEEGLDIYYRWALTYRPKRTTSDWEINVKSEYTGFSVLSEARANELWNTLNDRYGYKPGDVPQDVETYERRMRLVLDELKNPQPANNGGESDVSDGVEGSVIYS